VKLLVLSGPEVHGLLPAGACADAMRDALAARARGEVYQPLRTVIRPDGAEGLMALMPCYLPGGERAPGAPTEPGSGGYGLKAICIVPGNPARGLDAHQGIVLLSSRRPASRWPS
jgi:ornithine cyclodeaminase/alanine dehydrogenase-like protein (mu-crystallin family)